MGLPLAGKINIEDIKMKNKITWKQLTEYEPELIELYEDCKSIKDKGGKYFCANEVWYGGEKDGGFRDWLMNLVGWDAQKIHKYPILGTSEAYDLAYEKCYDALPDCRNCICM